MKTTQILSSLLTLPFLATQLEAHELTTSRPDGHAPIGVMADHTHKTGEWMASYRYMHMSMDGNRSDTDDVAVGDVLAGWPVSPLDMTMEMHMVGLMYAPSDQVTFMAMLPFTYLSMEHITRTGVRFSTETGGLADISLNGLYKIGQWENHGVHLNFGLSLPTGSIDETDATPMGPKSNLPYPMQTGSGTFDLLPGLTYLGQTADWSWGSQVRGTLRLGDNDQDYTLGNRFGLTGWLGRKLSDQVSISSRLDFLTWGNISGADPRINPAVVPTADPDRRAGERLDLLFGVNLMATEGFLKGHRIAIEGGIPVHQDLDGPQLETDWLMTVGWQLAW